MELLRKERKNSKPNEETPDKVNEEAERKEKKYIYTTQNQQQIRKQTNKEKSTNRQAVQQFSANMCGG